MSEQKFKIRVKSLDGTILTFHNVPSYESKEGLVTFLDVRKNLIKTFSSSAVEIEPMRVQE